MSQYDIFISYRRSDSAGHARALHRDLCRRFNENRVFFDRESIESGDIFPDRLREAVEHCKVLLALIAPGWLDVKDENGNRRLENEGDFVRQEIALALRAKKKVIPVLFDDVSMPTAKQLPENLGGLALFDALTLRGKGFEYDAQLSELLRLIANVPGIPELKTAELERVVEYLEKHNVDYIENYQHASVLGDHPADFSIDASELTYVERTFEPTISSPADIGLHRPQLASREKTNRETPGPKDAQSVLHEGFFLELLRGKQVCLLVEGEGGSGKTEFARHVAFRLAELMSKDSFESNPIPVLIEVGGIADIDELKSGTAFLASLSERSGYLSRPVDGETLFQHLLREGRLIIILDGLDELRDQSMFEDFDRALEEARRHSELGQCSLLVTGRPAAFGRTPRLRRSANKLRFRPRPIELVGIENYIHEFFGPENDPLAYQLIYAVREAKDSVRRLLSWPLFLTLTCIYWRSGDTGLLSSPTELMRRALEHLLSRRLRGRVQPAMEDLGRLARHSCPTFDVISHDEATRQVDEGNLEVYARDSGVLRGDVGNGYRFGIRPLAEYLAGRTLEQELNDDEVLITYEQHAWGTFWREPLYWMVGELWNKGREAVALKLLERLLYEIEVGRDDLSETLFSRACDIIGSGGDRSQLPDQVFERLASLVFPGLKGAEESNERLNNFRDEISAWPESLRDQLAQRVLDRADEMYNHIVAMALGSLSSNRGFEKLLEFLGPEQDDGDQQYAVMALGRIRNEHAVEVLVNFLNPQRGSDEVIRELCVRALGFIGSKVAIPALIECLEVEEEWDVRAEVYEALSKLGWEQVVPRLEIEIKQAREDPEYQLYPQQFDTLESLAALSDQTAIRALERYADPNWESDLYLQYQAGRALGRISNLTILLPEEIQDPDLDLAYEFRGLSEQAGVELVEEQSSPSDDNVEPDYQAGKENKLGTILAKAVRVSIIGEVVNRYFLVRIDELDPERCFERLIPLLDIEDAAARASIISAIGQCGSARAKDVLIDCLRNESQPRVLYAAVEAISEVGGKDAILALRRWLDPEASYENDLCWHVAQALLQIDPMNPEIAAACIDFEMSDSVAKAFRNLHSAAFCIESSHITERFQGDAIRAHALESDPKLSCVIVERNLLHLRHSGRGGGELG